MTTHPRNFRKVSPSYRAGSIREHPRDPALEEILQKLEALTAAQIELRCGVTAQTIRNWRNGKVRRPQNITLTFALRAAGYKRVIVKDGSR